ncbi:baseplate J/gp47 family protein [Paenibacillus piri]|uniref:Putative baseplate assembly protein n=1 Tax=Paenibacillus piri TaxID=2547395 RepID=A0A4R5KQV0_9BACL|nr:baseplate J/gp47 family protein [Paenibacillus piri]TDF97130.1 putative baseplate assembly protein [Paenibacillus piri]
MQPPKIDSNGIQDLIARMKEMAPYYTPEWRFSPEDPDPGTALFLLFAEMFQENVKRLNRVPMKNFIAFMNLLDVILLPARPASAFLTFRLNAGMADPIMLPAGTRASAAAADGDVLFETERALLLTPAMLTAAYLSSQKHDMIVRIPESFTAASNAGTASPTALFELREADNLQEHALFLEHGQLFLLQETASIELEIGHSLRKHDETSLGRQLADSRQVEWLYAAADGWKLFDRVELKGDRLLLLKSQAGELVESEVDGHAGRWIQCRMKRGAQHSGLPTLADQQLELDRIAVKTDYADSLDHGGISPDVMFYNDVQADPDGFYPFGDLFAPYGTFYIASREALSKLDGFITLSFGLKAIPNRFQPETVQPVDWKLIMKKSKFDKRDVPLVSVAEVLWEYWNGSTWARLNTGKEAERLFYHPGEELKRMEVTFRCPQNLQEVYVNSQLSYWIRVRILHIENMYAAEPVYLSPWMEDVKLTYRYVDRNYSLRRCLTLNNTAFVDRTAQSRGHGEAFAPFTHLESDCPSLYVSFNAPPVKGPISMYVSVQQQRLTEDDIPLLEWQYLRTGYGHGGSSAEWSPLKVIDDTNGLTRSGTVQFAGPADFAHARRFGTEGYWVRIVNRDGKYDDRTGAYALPVVNGMYINTVAALQQETVVGEYPDPRPGDIVSEFQLSRMPVVSETVWVDETGVMTEEEVLRHAEQGTLDMDVVRDSEGHIQRLWVKWLPVGHLADSGDKDRHYTIDRVYGRIGFGDGIHGMVPPKGGLEQIKVHYKVTRGRAGNVEAGHIVQLQNTIAFVEGVANPEAAAGGCDAEHQESALRRGPWQLKHRGRAVTAEDFEWLAREAYPNIARVKCLANYNALVKPDIGCITLVILPQEGVGGLAAFSELKKQVEKYILQRASNLVALPERIQVIQPAFLEVSVIANVAVQGLEAVVPTELEAIEKLQRFLDPLNGNYDGTGWQIGQEIHMSMFYSLLKSIRSINHVEKLYMTVEKVEDGVRTELDVNRLEPLLHGIVISGSHKVIVNAI